MLLRRIAFAAVGAALGFAYHRMVGCRTRACVLTANPYIATAWGALLGYLLSAPR